MFLTFPSDFLYGGPPCQDFSGCNRCPKANSIKNSLLTTFLSYADHYRPKYFLLENVRGLLQHRLGSTQKKSGPGVQGGIQQGSVKFILRALTSLGYSAQFHMLQAAEHGAPQSRRRVFFWGALLGRKLPLYPQPTHVCKGLSAPTNTFTMGRTAPHNPVTVGDSISDLPAFDWRIKVPGEDRQARRQRELGIPTVEVPSDGKAPIGDNRAVYAYGPIAEFQREVRRYVKGDIVKNHATRQWGSQTMLRLARIPMRPQANHNDLPLEHDMACLRNKRASKSNFYPKRYYRLDFKEQFQTCLTNVDPGGENGKVNTILNWLIPYFQRTNIIIVDLTSNPTPNSYGQRVCQGPRVFGHVYMGSQHPASKCHVQADWQCCLSATRKGSWKGAFQCSLRPMGI